MGNRLNCRWLVVAAALLAVVVGLANPAYAVAKPSITSLSVTTGVPGDTVSITGTNFAGATSVKFGSVAASSFGVNGPGTTATAVVPATARTGKISVVTAGGTALSADTFVVSGPSIASVTGSLGADSGGPGTTATVTGTNFTGTTAVKLGSSTATPFSVTGGGTTISFTVPTSAKTGKIAVTNPQGTGTSPSPFTVPAPTITTVTGSLGSDSGLPGTTATLVGTFFSGSTAVKFGSTAATPFAVNGGGTQITVTVPAKAKTGKISVTNPQGTGTSPSAFAVPGPDITSVTGSAGPDAGSPGSTATLLGTAFGGTTKVAFGNVTATPFAVNGGGTQIVVTVPLKAKTAKISVTNPQGTGLSSAFTLAPPDPTAVTGSLGSDSGAPGTTATITGTALGGVGNAPTVMFGVFKATSPSVNPAGTQIVVTVPLNAKTGKISVSTAQGTGKTATDFVVPTPSITTMTGSVGVNVGLPGTTATIDGTALGGTGLTSVVMFGSVKATSPSVNPAGTQIVVTVPVNAKTGKISVTTPQGTGKSATDFQVPAPSVTSMSGDLGANSGTPGNTATIVGQYFGTAPNVTLGSVKVTASVNGGGTQITFSIPAAAKTGKVTVTTPQGSGKSATDFVVPAPTVSTVTGDTGLNAGTPGATATIVGQYFGTAPVVSFGSTKASSPVVSGGGTQITVSVPLGATDGKVSVTTPQGVGLSATNFNVGPTITSFTPVSGTATAPGTTITVTGKNLGTVTTITVGGATVQPTDLVSKAPTKLVFHVPAATTTGSKSIVVTNAGGSATAGSTITIT